MGGVLPNGADGLDSDGWLSDWTVQDNVGSSLADRTEANVRSHYNSTVQGSVAWGAASNLFFNVILGGFATVTDLLKSIVSSITGVVDGGLEDLTSFFSSLADTISGALSSITSILTALSQIGDLFAGLLVTPINAFVQAIKDFFGGFGAKLMDAVVPGIGLIVDGVVSGIKNQSGDSGFSHDDMNAAVSAQTDSVSGQAAQIEQLQAALGKGNPDSDAFERTSLGGLWTVVGSNTDIGVTLDGHNLIISGNGDEGDIILYKNDIVAASDSMQVSAVLNSSAGSAPPLFPAAFGWNDLWLRLGAFTTWDNVTGLRWRINSHGTWSLDYAVNGVFTNLASGDTANLVGGTAIGFIAGVEGNQRRYQGTINGTAIMDFVEVGTGSQLGSSFRRRGLGGRSERLVLATINPGAYKQWTARG